MSDGPCSVPLMPLRGDVWLSPTCARGHHGECNDADSTCECDCHAEPEIAGGDDVVEVDPAVAVDPPAPYLGIGRRDPPPDLVAFDRSRGLPADVARAECRDPDCSRTFDTAHGAQIHYARTHGAKAASTSVAATREEPMPDAPEMIESPLTTGDHIVARFERALNPVRPSQRLLDVLNSRGFIDGEDGELIMNAVLERWAEEQMRDPDIAELVDLLERRRARDVIVQPPG